MLMVSKPTCKGKGHSSHLSHWKDGDDGLMRPTGWNAYWTCKVYVLHSQGYRLYVENLEMDWKTLHP